jgi:hypothetical protein
MCYVKSVMFNYTHSGNGREFSHCHCGQAGPGSHPCIFFKLYQGLLPWGQSDGSVKLTTHLHLWPRFRMCVALFPPTRNVICTCVRPVCEVTSYEMHDWDLILGMDMALSLRLRNQTCSGAHPAVYIISTEDSFTGVKATGACSLLP